MGNLKSGKRKKPRGRNATGLTFQGIKSCLLRTKSDDCCCFQSKPCFGELMRLQAPHGNHKEILIRRPDCHSIYILEKLGGKKIKKFGALSANRMQKTTHSNESREKYSIHCIYNLHTKSIGTVSVIPTTLPLTFQAHIHTLTPRPALKQRFFLFPVPVTMVTSNVQLGPVCASSTFRLQSPFFQSLKLDCFSNGHMQCSAYRREFSC